MFGYRRGLSSLFFLLVCAGLLGAGAPAHAAEAYKIPYADEDAFNERLSRGMRESYPAIDVELPAGLRKTFPGRLKAWLDRVSTTGGEVRFRDVSPPTKTLWLQLGIWAVQTLLQAVGPTIMDMILDPARNYHAVIVGEGYDPATATILGVEFYKRGSPEWVAASNRSKPMDYKVKP